jgi:hypothetical protein
MPVDQLQPLHAPPQLLAGAPPPLSLESIVRRTFAIWTRCFAPFTGVALLLNLPVLLAAAVLQLPAKGGGVVGWGLTLGSGLTALLVTGALTHGVLQALVGRQVGFAELVVTGFYRLRGLFVVSFGVGVYVLLGLMALVVPGLIALSMLWVAVPAAVAEPECEALSRSRQLTKGHRLTIFLGWLVFWLLNLAVVVGARAVGARLFGVGGSAPNEIRLLSELAGILVAGLGATAPTVAYHELRRLKEGVGTAELASVFD